MESRKTFDAIAEEGGVEALSLVATFMERNAAANDKLMNSLYEGERAAHEQTKEKLREAEDHLAQIEHRMMSLLSYDKTFWEHHYER